MLPSVCLPPSFPHPSFKLLPPPPILLLYSITLPPHLFSPMTKGAVCRLMDSAGTHRCIGSSIILQRSKTDRLPSRHFKTLLLQSSLLKAGLELIWRGISQTEALCCCLCIILQAGHTRPDRCLLSLPVQSVNADMHDKRNENKDSAPRLSERCTTLHSGMCSECGSALTQSP